MSIEKEYYISISDDAFEKIEKIGFNVVYSNLTSVKRDEYLSMIGIEDVKYGKIKCAGWIQITADDKTLEGCYLPLKYGKIL
jgi:hypothetical protein